MIDATRASINTVEIVDTDGSSRSIILGELAAYFEFDCCAYACQIYPPMSRPTMLEVGNLPAAWMQVYQAENLRARDPLLAYAHRSHVPLLWDENMVSRAPAYWQSARSHGLKHGCTIPLWTRHGCIGLMSFSRAERPLLRDEFDSKVVDLIGIAQEIHAGLLSRHMSDRLQNAGAALSERERTILKWTADGKTSSEVALILGLTRRTIDFHVQRAVGKLNSTNKTQATLKAAVLGLLF